MPNPVNDALARIIGKDAEKQYAELNSRYDYVDKNT